MEALSERVGDNNTHTSETTGGRCEAMTYVQSWRCLAEHRTIGTSLWPARAYTEHSSTPDLVVSRLFIQAQVPAPYTNAMHSNLCRLLERVHRVGRRSWFGCSSSVVSDLVAFVSQRQRHRGSRLTLNMHTFQRRCGSGAWGGLVGG